MEQKYSQEEVDHLVAREVAKQRMADLERQIGSVSNEVKTAFANLQATMQGLEKAIDRQNKQAAENRSDFRQEIERDFVSKIHFAAIESKLQQQIQSVAEQTKLLWAKITASIAVLLIVLQYLWPLVTHA